MYARQVNRDWQGDDPQTDAGSAADNYDFGAADEAPLPPPGYLPIDISVRERWRAPAQPLYTFVEKSLRRFGVEFSPWLERLAEAWPDVVGTEVAARCRPGKFKDAILYVYVRNSVDLFNLRRQNLAAMEQAVRRFAGSVTVRQIRLAPE